MHGGEERGGDGADTWEGSNFIFAHSSLVNWNQGKGSMQSNGKPFP